MMTGSAKPLPTQYPGWHADNNWSSLNMVEAPNTVALWPPCKSHFLISGHRGWQFRGALFRDEVPLKQLYIFSLSTVFDSMAWTLVGFGWASNFYSCNMATRKESLPENPHHFRCVVSGFLFILLSAPSV